MTISFPARLHVLLAAQAPLGLVIRRGPSKQVATLLWDRRTDQFQLGQWLKGRIYERRSDLSPDGQYVIYFAMNGHWQSESTGSWTAISRAPYLKALVMMPWGSCWLGGGLWTGNTRYWLNGCADPADDKGSPVRRDRLYVPEGGVGAECLSVYYPRLLRDGWTLTDLGTPKGITHRTDIFDKPLNHGWALRKLAHAGCNDAPGRSCYWDTHQLIHHPESNTTLDFDDWEWAERDGDRLVWVTAGKLFAGEITTEGLANPTELFDFNDMTFEAIAAPY